MTGRSLRRGLLVAVAGTLGLLALSSSMGRAQDTSEVPPGFASYDTDGSGKLSDAECAALSDGAARDLRLWINGPDDGVGIFNTLSDKQARQRVEALFDRVQYRIRDNGYQSEDHRDDCGRVMDDLPMDCGGLTGPLRCTTDAIGETTSTAAENANVVKKGFEKVADLMADSYEKLLETATTMWLGVPSTSGESQQVLAWIHDSQHMRLLIGLVGGVAFIIAACKLALSSSGDAFRGMAGGLLRLAAVSTFGMVLVQSALTASDEWSSSLVSAAVNDGTPSEGLKTLLASSPGLMFMLAVLGIITSLIQIVMLVVRNAALLVLVGAWPLSAAASVSGDDSMFRRTSAWIGALVLYKPAAALVYATGFRLLHEDQAFGGEILAAIQGMVLLALAVLALPAMIRLVVPAASMGGPSTAGVVAGTAAVVAGGAAITSGGLRSLLGGSTPSSDAAGAGGNLPGGSTGSPSGDASPSPAGAPDPGTSSPSGAPGPGGGRSGGLSGSPDSSGPAGAAASADTGAGSGPAGAAGGAAGAVVAAAAVGSAARSASGSANDLADGPPGAEPNNAGSDK